MFESLALATRPDAAEDARGCILPFVLVLSWCGRLLVLGLFRTGALHNDADDDWPLVCRLSCGPEAGTHCENHAEWTSRGLRVGWLRFGSVPGLMLGIDRGDHSISVSSVRGARVRWLSAAEEGDLDHSPPSALSRAAVREDRRAMCGRSPVMKGRRNSKPTHKQKL
jgi:hypothetical protein